MSRETRSSDASSIARDERKASKSANLTKMIESDRGVAREILATPDASLEINVRKVKNLCKQLAREGEKDELERTAETGKLEGGFLYSLLRGVAMTLHADVELNEGLYSLIKTMSNRAPRISLCLLSARLGIKHAIGRASANQNVDMDGRPARPARQRASPTSWGSQSKRLEGLLSELSSAYAERASEVTSDTLRWQTPDPVPVLPDRALKDKLEDCNMKVRLLPDHIWAAPYNALAFKVAQRPDLRSP